MVLGMESVWDSGGVQPPSGTSLRPRRLRLSLASLAVLAVLVGGTALPAQAAGASHPNVRYRLPAVTQVAADPSTVPPGWTFVEGQRTGRLEWRSDVPIPIGDSAVEFWWGQVRLGVARPLPDGRTFRLDVPSLPSSDLSRLRVTGGVGIGSPRSTGSGPAAGSSADAAAVERQFRSLPRVTSDPGVPGRYTITSSSYRLAPLALAEYPEPVEMLGRVIRPTDAQGPRPLVVFLHGRHSTCYKGNRSSGEWPCRTGWKPIPSYLGYLEAQRLLASQGYVTVSISANGINGQDWESVDGGAEARSRLVRRHLDHWSDWASTGGAPFGTDLVGAVDLDRVVLVGHSRGGEGVNRAAIDSMGNPRWSIAGQVLIGPTAFGRQSLPGLNSVVLLPFCDGDVSDLQGQQYVDQSRDVVDDTDRSLRSAVMVMGANHNYFNREWTPGESKAPSFDDWGANKDPLCGKSSPRRLSPEEQRNVGSTYIAAAAHVFAGGNRSQLPLIDGSPLRAPSADPAVVQVTALGANRSPVYRPAKADSTSAVGAVTSRVCQGWGKRVPICAPRQASPHLLPMDWQQTDPAPVAWEASWKKASGRALMRLPQPVDLSGSGALELRVAPEKGTRSTRFVVRVVDGSGAGYDVGTASVRALPSTRAVSHLWAKTVRLPLTGATVDLSDIRRIALVPESATGHLYVLDVHGRSPGLATVQPQVLPRLDVVDAEVLEGDNGDHIVNLKVDVQGAIAVPLRFWMGVSDAFGATPTTSKIVTLSPGDTSLNVPIHVDGDQRDDYDTSFTVMLRALHEAVTGHYVGTLRVRDDDPAARATVTSTATAVEGRPLRWTISLDRQSDIYVSFDFELVPPAAGLTELSTNDVPVRWLQRCGQVPRTPKPMSQARFYCTSVSFPPGVTDGALVIPTVRDTRVEGDESVAWTLVWGDPEMPDPPWQLVGTVSDGA